MAVKALIEETRVPVKIWTEIREVEQAAVQQLSNIANLPVIFHHVAAMSDVHLGKGATVGSVVPTQGGVIPAAVGVDIGCGMTAVKLPFQIDQLGGQEGLKKLRQSIERSIPLGNDSNRKVTPRMSEAFESLGPAPATAGLHALEIAKHQIGSLGGGNHFIEVCTDTEGNAWAVLHSGSRNIGKRLADIHIDRAKAIMKERGIQLPDADLSYIPEDLPEFQDYVRDVTWAQNYAQANRNEMMLRLLKDISFHVYGEDRGAGSLTVFRVDCHHNYIARENHFGQEVWVTRKGAVRARREDYGIIPGSMGAKTFIVKGKGNPESFESCSHGAGRKMSRGEAKRHFTVQDLCQQTEGVECRKDARVLDEIPGAYKDIQEVMANQSDLVEIVAELKQLITVKG